MSEVFPINTIATAIKAAVAAVMPAGTPGYILVDPAALAAETLPLAYTVMPMGSVIYSPSKELQAEIQGERWQWMVYLTIGSGNDTADSLDDIQTHLGAITSALVGLEPEGEGDASGPLERTSGGFYGFANNGAIFGVQFWHRRDTGEEP